MILSDLESKRLAIWGLGKEGMESYRFLRAHFPAKPLLLINRDEPNDPPKDDDIHFMREDDLNSHITDIDVVIKAPGISLYHPLVPLLKQHHIQITSATNIWFAQAPTAPVIAITGTNGKSTTCALLTHILNGMGFRAELGGNIGTPLLSLKQDADYYVVELSSYQTADLAYAPDIAVLLNLFPEHIQWHQSHDQYYRDKCTLIKSGAKTVILNRTDPLTGKIVTSFPPGTIWFNDPNALHMTGDYIFRAKDRLGRRKDITLPGDHNGENICAALTVCATLGLDPKKSFELATGFRGLPHRLENLGTFDSITYINDSISTTPEAAIAALKSYEGRHITLLAGGQDRGQDYTRLTQYIMDHPEIRVITAYETGPRISAALPTGSPFIARDLKDAVAKARDITPKDGLILLSPAAPSYDAFKNFEERGDIFKKLCGIPLQNL